MIKMDGKGQCVNNVFVERLWHSVKYKEVYLKAYRSPRSAPTQLEQCFQFCNTERRYKALGRQTHDAASFKETDKMEAA